MLANDTIVASGQASENSNVTVDGGYNTDDANGASFGAQVRTPLEAIQELQVVTSMYGAEHGRAGAAIVNVVTRQGTNTFRGVEVGPRGKRSPDGEGLLCKRGKPSQPEVTKREWGFVGGGPVVRNKAHFFFSLERQVDQPNRTGVFSTRPSLNFSIAEDRTSWNTLSGLITRSTRTTPGRSGGCARTLLSILLSERVPLRRLSGTRPTETR